MIVYDINQFKADRMGERTWGHTCIYIYTYAIHIYIHMIICLSRGNILSYEYTHIYIVMFSLSKTWFSSFDNNKIKGN